MRDQRRGSWSARALVAAAVLSQSEASAQGAPRRAPNDGMTIEGQLGTLTRAQLDRVFRPLTPELTRCYTERLAENPYLSGRVDLRLRIATDGAVRWAVASANSTLGDRVTEQCMIDRLRAARFDAPEGGEAEVTLPIELDGGDDVRPATAWAATRIAPVYQRRRAAVRQCIGSARGAFDITVYAAPRGGSIATAGVSAQSPDERTPAVVECILREVQSWRLPDPGSWYAKATLRAD